MLPRLLALYKQAGFRFVTLPKAAADRDNVGLVDPALPPLPERTLGDANSNAVLQHIGTFCS
jgi:hypothetical protein